MRDYGTVPLRVWRVLAVALAMVLIGSACSRQPAAAPAPTGDRLQVTVSILPEKYLVERVGGDHVVVNVLVGPGDEPHSYEPVAEQLRALSRSVVYFTVGVEFETAWMDRFRSANPALEIVDTRAGIQLLPEPDQPAARSTGEGLMDPHIWLSPRRAGQMAGNMADALIRLDPAHEADYRANLAAFMADVDALDGEIRTTLAGVSGHKFLIFHPAWGYYAADYGLEQIAIEVGGQEPSAAEMAAIVSEAEKSNIRVVFAQPNLSTRSAEAIATEIGGHVVLVNDLAEDWLENLRRVTSALAEGLAG